VKQWKKVLTLNGQGIRIQQYTIGMKMTMHIEVELHIGDEVYVETLQMFGRVDDIEDAGWYWIKINGGEMLTKYRAARSELKRVAGV
jgi:hypothetical protein